MMKYKEKLFISIHYLSPLIDKVINKVLIGY